MEKPFGKNGRCRLLVPKGAFRYKSRNRREIGRPENILFTQF
jgi:hypothetical protein